MDKQKCEEMCSRRGIDASGYPIIEFEEEKEIMPDLDSFPFATFNMGKVHLGGRPDRNWAINGDDLLDLKIALKTVDNFDDFLSFIGVGRFDGIRFFVRKSRNPLFELLNYPDVGIKKYQYENALDFHIFEKVEGKGKENFRGRT